MVQKNRRIRLRGYICANGREKLSNFALFLVVLDNAVVLSRLVPKYYTAHALEETASKQKAQDICKRSKTDQIKVYERLQNILFLQNDGI